MSESLRSYRDLVVWQKAMCLVDEIDRIVELLMPFQRWWLGIEMLRTALSIASNIAEGHDADHLGLYLRRLADAKGSTRELETQVLVARRRKNVGAHETDVALGLTDEIGRMLRSLGRRLQASSKPRKRLQNPNT
jgi:four helix bundle protein